MPATVAQLAQIQVFAQLETSQLQGLQAYSRVQDYQAGEIVMNESDRIPAKLFALLNGSLRVTKIAKTGKETILRTLSAGEIFAAPALLGKLPCWIQGNWRRSHQVQKIHNREKILQPMFRITSFWH